MSGPARAWRRVVGWALLILVATTVPLSEAARRVSIPLADKLVHGVLYAVLGWLVGGAVSSCPRRGKWPWLLALLGLALFAAVDEAHQVWLPGRIPSAGDWLADLLGATIGLGAGIMIATAPWTRERDAARGRESDAG